jgi:hypothetical protein
MACSWERVMPSIEKSILVAAFLGLASTAASADVLFQSVPNLSETPTQFYCSTCSSFFPQRQYDAFTLSGAASLTSVVFNAPNDVNALLSASFQIGIFQARAVPGGMAGALIANFNYTSASITSQTDTLFGDRDVGTISVPLSLALAAGSYDISFYSSTRLGVPYYTNGSGLLSQTEPSFPGPAFLPHPGQLLGFALNGVASAVPDLPPGR